MLAFATIERLLQGLLPPQPGGQHEARLRPGEYPGDRPQAFHATLAALGRAATERQSPQFLLRRRLAEVLDELRMVAHHPAIRRDALLGQMLHQVTPARLGHRRRQQRGFQDGGQVEVEVLLGDVRQAELEANHFTLFGGAEAPRDRTWRLRQDGRMSRSAATADGATAPMEQQQFDTVLATDVHQIFLGAVLRPGRRRGAGVLGRIGIADHHFLRPVQALPITRQGQQPAHGRPGIVQVGEGFEQRHHAHRALQAGLFQQQLDRQHIGRAAGHGDDVGSQRRGRSGRDHPAGGQHLGRVFGRLVMGRQERTAVVQFSLEEIQALLFVPCLVVAQAEVIGDLAKRRGMPGRILANIQAHQEQAEGGDAAQGVEQRTVGDHTHATGVQGPVAEFQRLPQLPVVVQHLRRRRLLCPRRTAGPFPGDLQAFAQRPQQSAIGLCGIARLAQQFGAGGLHRERGDQSLDVM